MLRVCCFLHLYLPYRYLPGDASSDVTRYYDGMCWHGAIKTHLKKDGVHNGTIRPFTVSGRPALLPETKKDGPQACFNLFMT